MRCSVPSSTFARAGLRGAIVAHKDMLVERGIPYEKLYDAHELKQAQPRLHVSVSLLTYGSRPVTLQLGLCSPVRVKRHAFTNCGQESALFPANVIAVDPARQTADVRYVDAVDMLVGRDALASEFNVATQIDLPLPPWSVPLQVWMRGLQIDLLLADSDHGDADSKLQLVNSYWEEPLDEEQARGRLGCVVIDARIEDLQALR